MRDQARVAETIQGFAGELLGEIDDRQSYLSTISLGRFDCLMYMRPAAADYHLPQDAVGVYREENSLWFAVADGVSLVRGTTVNHSGELALQLVQMLPRLNKDWQQTVDGVVRKFQEEGLIGASTLVLGCLVNTSEDYELRLYVVGSQYDTGYLHVVTENESQQLPNQSNGFIPRYYQPDEYQMRFNGQFRLILSTDGIAVESTTTDILRNVIISEVSEKHLAGLLPIQPDDQTLLMIDIS